MSKVSEFYVEKMYKTMNSARYYDYACCWNKDYCQTFAVCRKVTSCFLDGAPAHRLHYAVPEFIELANRPPVVSI